MNIIPIINNQPDLPKFNIDPQNGQLLGTVRELKRDGELIVSSEQHKKYECVRVDAASFTAREALGSDIVGKSLIVPPAACMGFMRGDDRVFFHYTSVLGVILFDETVRPALD